MITLRIKEHQREAVRQKAIEINRILIKKGKEPLKDSELLHLIIDKGVSMVQASEDGEVNLIDLET